MLSDNHSVLQVSAGTTGRHLERAWQASRTRFMRLTSKGPLRFYRHDLLKEADHAYQSLSDPSRQSLPAQQVDRRPPVKSSIRTGTILGHKPLPLAGRELKKVTRQATAKIEDKFCLEVLCRLEGDLLRFSCRRELLGLAQNEGIHGFRANMLMAQIIESVRQHKLYEISGTQKEVGVHKYRGGKKWKQAMGLAGLCILIDILIVAIVVSSR
jgi:hypothetical protein